LHSAATLITAFHSKKPKKSTAEINLQIKMGKNDQMPPIEKVKGHMALYSLWLRSK